MLLESPLDPFANAMFMEHRLKLKTFHECFLCPYKRQISMLHIIHFALMRVLVHCNCSVFMHLLDIGNYIRNSFFVSSMFFVLLENFHSFADLTIPGERLYILT